MKPQHIDYEKKSYHILCKLVYIIEHYQTLRVNRGYPAPDDKVGVDIIVASWLTNIFTKRD